MERRGYFTADMSSNSLSMSHLAASRTDYESQYEREDMSDEHRRDVSNGLTHHMSDSRMCGDQAFACKQQMIDHLESKLKRAALRGYDSERQVGQLEQENTFLKIDYRRPEPVESQYRPDSVGHYRPEPVENHYRTDPVGGGKNDHIALLQENEALRRELRVQANRSESLQKFVAELEVQKDSHAQLDRQIRDMSERHATTMQKHQAELDQARKDLQKERQLVIEAQVELQQAQSQQRKDRDRALSSDTKFRDAQDELEQEKERCRQYLMEIEWLNNELSTTDNDTTTHNELRNELEAMKARCLGLEAQDEQQREQEKRDGSSMKRASNAVEQAQEELRRNEEELVRDRELLETTKQALRQEKDRNSTLQAELAESATANKTVTQRLEKVQAELSQKEVELGHALEENESLRDVIRLDKERREKLEAEQSRKEEEMLQVLEESLSQKGVIRLEKEQRAVLEADCIGYGDFKAERGVNQLESSQAHAEELQKIQAELVDRRMELNEEKRALQEANEMIQHEKERRAALEAERIGWLEEFERLERKVVNASSTETVERLQIQLNGLKEELNLKARALDDAKEVIRQEKERRTQLEAERMDPGCDNNSNRAYVIKSTTQALQKAQEDLQKKNAEIKNLKDELEEQQNLVSEYKAEQDQQAQDGQERRNEVDKELERTRTALAFAQQELAEMKDKSESTSLTFSQDMTSFAGESCGGSVVEYEESIDYMVTETEVMHTE